MSRPAKNEPVLAAGLLAGAVAGVLFGIVAGACLALLGDTYGFRETFGAVVVLAVYGMGAGVGNGLAAGGAAALVLSVGLKGRSPGRSRRVLAVLAGTTLSLVGIGFVAVASGDTARTIVVGVAGALAAYLVSYRQVQRLIRRLES